MIYDLIVIFVFAITVVGLMIPVASGGKSRRFS